MFARAARTAVITARTAAITALAVAGTVVVAPGTLADAATVAAPDSAAVDTLDAADTPVAATALTPALFNDPRRSQQWAMTRLGAEALRARRAATGVVVAVIDSGVQGSHPDLVGRLVNGYDFTTNRATTPATSVDGYGHGTHIAGLVAASVNNRTGVAGLAPDARIMPLRVLDNSGAGWGSDVARALTWAADHGAKVANVSLASDYSQPVADAVRYAQGKGVVVVAAVGNNRQIGNRVSYPAALPGVIGVAAEDSSGRVASFSNTGSYVDITAPGVSVLGTYKGSSYVSMSGTSMAAPYVAATVAVLKSINPAMTGDSALAVMQRTARDLGTRGRDTASGAGEVQPLRAVCSVMRCS